MKQRVAGRPWPPPCACARRAGPPQRGHHGVACTREGPAVSYSTRGLSLVQSPRAVCCAGLQYECGPWPVQKNAGRACRVAVGKRSHDRPKDICGARSRIYGVNGAVAPSNASSGATRFDYGRWRRELSSSRSASGRLLPARASRLAHGAGNKPRQLENWTRGPRRRESYCSQLPLAGCRVAQAAARGDTSCTAVGRWLSEACQL